MAALRQDKDRLRHELELAIEQGLRSIEEERRKEQDLAQQDLAAREKAFRQKEAVLLAEIGQLKDLVEDRSRQVADMHGQLVSQHAMFTEEARGKDDQIMELKERVHRLLVNEEV
jgi:hypothetical protein